jgi:putative heme-binding domain-containing protein
MLNNTQQRPMAACKNIWPTLVLLLAAIKAAAGAEPPPKSGFTVPDDLRFELLLKEPQVRQPVNISFDERGRMWVVQYLQYPSPAGLKMLSRDSVWRVQYDKVPPPPPHHVVGADKISIFEDTDGDGQFDKEKTFVDGLNIATSVCRGRGGVFVTNPPYLLFYADRDNDDVPDGNPEVCLEGFGLEDTHSVVNSLCWGPDGWLYGAQGSTVTGAVKRPGSADPPVHSLGQLIWRYHPELKRYEVFAEGGGNAFGVEIDSVGRIYSGHNGGNTRGFHYVQGGYFQKGFDKHGPLSNPYTFGYFPAMKHEEVQRFTHTFVIYDGDGLPQQYYGRLFGVAPLLHHVVMSKIEPDGSTFQTHDIGYAAATQDAKFVPVDIKQGPDGALYVADWYDEQCNHYRNHEGHIDKSTGRIYRLSAADAKLCEPEDLSECSSHQLVERLKNPSKWQRQTALRLLADRRDLIIAPLLKQQLRDDSGQLALESLWALNAVGGLDEPTLLAAFNHANPQVRLWAVRLMCDSGNVSVDESKQLVALATKECDPEACCQIACSARRLPAADCLPIVRALLKSNNADDPHLPLLVWWAIEAKVASDASLVIDLFRDPEIWPTPIAKQVVAERLMRRFAATGHRSDLSRCAELLNLAPESDDAKRLMTGFEAAFAGRSLPDLPKELATALEKYSGASVVLGLRQGNKAKLEEALNVLRDDHADRSKQIQYLQVLGEVNQPECVPTLITLATHSPDNALQAAAIRSLARYNDTRITPAILATLPKLSDDVRAAAGTLLITRTDSTLALLQAIESQRIDKSWLSTDVVQRTALFSDSKIDQLVKKLWPELQPTTPEELKGEIARIDSVLKSGLGRPKEGFALFERQCSKCHQLFGKGGNVGPDLTSFNRNDFNTMLLSVVHPSAEIREGYSTYVVLTMDGRALTGTLAEQDSQTVTLKTADSSVVTIPRADIEEMDMSKQSMMPEGLLKSYSDQELRDLFAYLRMSQPLIDR